MGELTAIEWTDHTFNPWWGCARVSAGCQLCYAEAAAERYGHDVWGKAKERRTFGDKHWNEPLRWNRKAEAEGRPRLVFCASMADVFEDHPEVVEERQRLWALIEATPWLRWQLLTKRPENVRAMTPWGTDWPPNAWVGVSVEDQQRADERLPWLMGLERSVLRFVSYEPALGRVDFRPWLDGSWCDHASQTGLAATRDGLKLWCCDSCWALLVHRHVPGGPLGQITYDVVDGGRGIDWLICGGETGSGARPMHTEWARATRDACTAAGVPFFFKQWGDWVPVIGGSGPRPFPQLGPTRSGWFCADGRFLSLSEQPETRVYIGRVGKRAAGHGLDGKVWQQLPEVAPC